MASLPPWRGEARAATAARPPTPVCIIRTDVALDTAGNLYIADTFNNCIRKVDNNGLITTVAGQAASGYSGDGGAATNAKLNRPQGVVADDWGNLYVSDSNNSRVRKVDPNGIITTAVGKSNAGFSGDGGAPTNASLNSPTGLTLDVAGNLYIADTSNNRIRKWLLYASYPRLTLSGVQATDAGNYTVVITSPYGSTTSQLATLTVQAPPVITAQPASRIVAVGNDASFSVTAAGSKPFGYLWYLGGVTLLQSGTNSVLTLPGVSTNAAGQYTVVITNAYGAVTSQVATLTVALPPSVIGQLTNQTMFAGASVTFSVVIGGTGPFNYQWRFNGTNIPNNIITTVAGNGNAAYAGDNGPATNASLNFSTGVALDAAGMVYIADQSNERVRQVDTNGIITTVAGNGTATFAGDGGAATNASLNSPYNLTLDPARNLYIADENNNRVRKVDANGIITTVAGNGKAGFSGDGGAATNANLRSPCGVALDGAGNLYIADTYNHSIRKVDANGYISKVAGRYVGGYGGDGGAATNAGLNYPLAVALDAAGDLFVADSSNNRIRRVDPNGIIATIAGNGRAAFVGDGGMATNASLNDPGGLALDTWGNLYVSDGQNFRVREVNTDGIISTVAGNGSFGSSGDGGAATNASITPSGLALDAAGNLYIADCFMNRIREVHLAGDPAFALTNVSVGNAGHYTVVVTSPYGSVTSAVAVLTVTIPRTPPQIITGDTSFGFRSNQFGFNVSGGVGQTIVVDGSTDLVGWFPLFTNTVSVSPFYFSDPTATNFPRRFYRGRLP